jgi:hypothetical protein
MLVTSLSATAAERGFYVGATASRVEQELDRNGGFLVPVLGFVPGPPLSGIIQRPPPTPIFVGDPSFVSIPSFGAAVLAQPDRVEVDDVDAGWSVTLGYRINEYLAAEVAYMDFGEASLTQSFDLAGVPPLLPPREYIQSYTFNVRGPAASLLGSYPVSTNWQVFARGGVLFADQEVKSAVTFTPAAGTGRFEQTFGDEVWLAGAGVQWSFAPRWTARLEYQRTGDLDSSTLAGESSIDQASLSVLFSL